eukprot:scaffold2353_cov167-Amphora_coffeaeformis.AAC.40
MSSMTSNLHRRALVIGAGPSGLVAAKYLQQDAKHLQLDEIIVLEASHDMGGTFINKVYDGTRLVSSKYITAFSDFRMSPEMPNHPSAQEYVAYLQTYCEAFRLRRLIQFGCRVLSITDSSTNDCQYTVQYRQEKDQNTTTTYTEDFDYVLVASGLHNIPYMPKLPRQEDFAGTIIHSSDYKDPSIFQNARVLILGSGETAMDIAYRAIQTKDCISVAMNVRRGFLSIPHNLAEDRPLDVFITNWLEHAYEHPWIHKTRLRWWLSTVIIRFFLMLTGSSCGFNQWACTTQPIVRGYHIINKSHAAMGYLNVPIKRKTAWGRFWLWVYGEQNLRPIESFHKTEIVGCQGNTVSFSDGRSYQADVIICATGYRQSFPFLDSKIKKEFQQGKWDIMSDVHGEKYAIDEDALPSDHFIASPRRPNLGFIGFVRPNVGAIPPMSELQVMWFLQNLQGKVHRQDRFLPIARPSYLVLGNKYPYGVDYGNYMHRVAEDIGAAPTFSVLATKASHPIRALYTYARGQAHIPIFRLQGPYASKQCWDTFENELWEVCKKRGIVENLGLAVVTWLSIWMNLGACLLECLWGLVSFQKPRFFARRRQSPSPPKNGRTKIQDR